MKQMIVSLLLIVMPLLACNMSVGKQGAAVIPSLTPETPTQAAVWQTTPMFTNTPSVMPTVQVQATQSPNATPQLMPICTPRADWALYTVAVGDTLGSIAARTGTSVAALVSANCIANPNMISVGQVLSVPSTPKPIPPRIVSFVGTSSYPPEVVWRTEGTSQVLLYVSGPNGASKLLGVYGPNGSIPMPVVEPEYGPITTFTLTIRDMNGQDVIGNNGLPVKATFDFATATSPVNSQPDCPPASDGGTTMLEFAPIEARWSACVVVKANQTITVSWPSAPSHVNAAEFWFTRSENCPGAAGIPDVIGTDNDPSNGLSISWYVGPDVCTGWVYAMGWGSEANSMVSSLQHPFVIR